MLFESTGCRTIENKCSLFARLITENWQDISLPDLLSVQVFKVCFVYLSS